MAVHVVPVKDLIDHKLTVDCPCDPVCEFVDPKTGEMLDQTRVTHNPADGKTGHRPGGWRTVDDDGDPEYGAV